MVVPRSINETEDTTMVNDYLKQRAHAEAIVERAADQLRDLLVDLVKEVDPFPPFPGSMFTSGIEVQPTSNSSLGCVIVGDDAELYELELGLDHEEISRGGDAHAARIEHAIELDLTKAEYVTTVHAAIQAVATYLETRD
tara:strand:- start:4784 stop:5203 length:420 start_codon:yes stop_codon:yes gene_type:complete